MYNIIIFGPPGSGKGTQSKLVSSHYNFLHLSTGDLFRKEIANKSLIGNIVKKFMDRGLLIPDSIVMRELYRYALENRKSPGIVFDGFPRTLEQAKTLDKLFNKKELRINLVISMLVSNDELINRILERGKNSDRTDDNIEVMTKRLEIYNEHTFPVINYYKKTHRLHEISGKNSIDDVFESIKTIIDKERRKK